MRNFIKKKGFCVACLTLALSLMLVNCTSSVDDVSSGVSPQTVAIRIVGSPSRAVGSPLTGTAQFKSGYLFFVTKQTNMLKQCYRITPTDGAPTSLKDFVINIDDFWSEASGSSGYTFENIPGDVDRIYMIGNVPENGSTEESAIRAIKSLDELQKVAIPFTAQEDNSAVTMDGIGNITDAGGRGIIKKEASIQLVPFASRIEIPSITVNGEGIKSYKVAGIYISHFYKNMALNEKPSEGELYKYTTAKDSEYTSTYKMMADVDSGDTGLGEQIGLKTTPGSGKVWGYQFMPGKSGESVRIVIKLKDIVSDGTHTYSGVQYINIRGLIDNSNGESNPTPMSLSRGKVYNFGENLVFDEVDITPTPNPDDIDLTIKVSVKNWDVVNVKPVM